MIIQERYVISLAELVFALEKCNHNIRGCLAIYSLPLGRGKGEGELGASFLLFAKLTMIYQKKQCFSGTGGQVLQTILQQTVPQDDRQTDA